MSQSKVRLSKLPINGKDSMKAADVFVYGGSGDPSEISSLSFTSLTIHIAWYFVHTCGGHRLYAGFYEECTPLSLNYAFARGR